MVLKKNGKSDRFKAPDVEASADPKIESDQGGPAPIEADDAPAEEGIEGEQSDFVDNATTIESADAVAGAAQSTIQVFDDDVVQLEQTDLVDTADDKIQALAMVTAIHVPLAFTDGALVEEIGIATNAAVEAHFGPDAEGPASVTLRYDRRADGTVTATVGQTVRGAPVCAPVVIHAPKAAEDDTQTIDAPTLDAPNLNEG